MRRIASALCLSLLFCFSSLEAKENIDSLYDRFNTQNISRDTLNRWLEQFDMEDRDTALALLENLHYLTHPQIVEGVKVLHEKVLERLRTDGFIGNDVTYEKIDFSKIYTAKSGDLISYFYRSANNIKPYNFKNISELSQDHQEMALVLIDDYLSTGTQFFYRAYGQEHHKLFNSYKKVYLAVLVANKSALEKLKKIKDRDASLVQDFAHLLKVQDEQAKHNIATILNRIDPNKIEVIYWIQEEPLIQFIKDIEMRERVTELLRKNKLEDILQRLFIENLSIEDYGRTIFFYSCPNNLPPILWSSKLLKKNGSFWIPIFERMEGNSLYNHSKLP